MRSEYLNARNVGDDNKKQVIWKSEETTDNSLFAEKKARIL